MRFQLSLFQKALILVAVPLAFELLLLGNLTGLIEEARQAQHAEAVIAQTKEVEQNFYNVGFSFIAYDARTQPAFERRFVEDFDKVMPGLERLRKLVKEKPDLVKIVDDVTNLASH